MKLKLFAFVLLGASLLQAQSYRRITLGYSDFQLNGIDARNHAFGQAQTGFGLYGFYDQQLYELESSNVAGVNPNSIAGSWSNPGGENIEGFQWWPQSKQFFSFEWGATATFIVGQLPDGTVEGWYDDFHFKDISFIATPIFDQHGAVLSYTSAIYSVPGAVNTQILGANSYGRVGTFQDASGAWLGFIDRNGKITSYAIPGAAVSLTALDAHCYAGYSITHNRQQSFLRCDTSPNTIPVKVGVASWVKQITATGQLVGYAVDEKGNRFGFVWSNR